MSHSTPQIKCEMRTRLFGEFTDAIHPAIKTARPYLTYLNFWRCNAADRPRGRERERDVEGGPQCKSEAHQRTGMWCGDLIGSIQQRAEQTPRHSDEVLRLVIDTIPTMAWTVRSDGVVDFVNQRWLDYTGLTFEEEIEEPTRAMHPEDLQRVMEKWLAHIAAGESFEDEMRLRQADGEYRWFLVRTVPLRDELGNIVKWYGTSIDIEDRKRAEDDLRRQKEILQRIFDNVPVMIGFVGPNGKIKLANREWERTLGWTLEEVLVQDLDVFAELYPDPKYRQAVLNFVFESNAEWPHFTTRARDGRVIDTT